MQGRMRALLLCKGERGRDRKEGRVGKGFARPMLNCFPCACKECCFVVFLFISLSMYLLKMI